MRAWHLTIVALGLALDLSASPAGAADVPTVQAMLDACHDPEASPGWMYCAGVLEGAMDPMEIAGELLLRGIDTNKNLRMIAMCPGPKGVTGAAMIQAFENWAAANPQDWNWAAPSGALAALGSTWPCN